MKKVLMILIILFTLVLIAGCPGYDGKIAGFDTCKVPCADQARGLPAHIPPFCTCPTPNPIPQIMYVAATPTPIAIPTTVSTAAPVPSLTPAVIQTTQTLIAADDPQISNFAWIPDYLTFNIDNCSMHEIFPDIAKDPAYGMKVRPQKITAFSPAQIAVFLRSYTKGTGANAKMTGFSQCEGQPYTPTWNFIKVGVLLTPRNARPAVYAISVVARTGGKDIAEFKTNRTLTLDQSLSLEYYVPLQTQEMDLVDGFVLRFNKLNETG